MSLVDLTRTAFQSGVSAKKWAGLCKLLIEQRYAEQTKEAIGLAVCNSVLVLTQVHHGDPVLKEYLATAINTGIIPLSVFIRTFLQVAQSQGAQQPTFWVSLCTIVVQAQRETGSATLDGIVNADQSPSTTLGSIHDALNLISLVRFPSDHGYDIGNLLNLLISCVNSSQMSQVPATQLASTLNLVVALLHSTQLPMPFNQALQGLEVDLRFAMDSSPGGSNSQASMMTVPVLSSSQLDSQPMDDTDIIICSSILSLLVEQRGGPNSSASSTYAVNLMVSFWKWTGWILPIFYRQLLLAATTKVSEFVGNDRYNRPHSRLWKAFVIGRLPALLRQMDDLQSGGGAEGRAAIQNAVYTVLQRTDLIQRCNCIHLSNGEISSDLDHFSRPFLAQMITHGLLDTQGWDGTFLSREWSVLGKEAQALGSDLNDYINVKLTTEPHVEELTALIASVVQDYSAHVSFCVVLSSRLQTFMEVCDVDGLSCFARVLMNNPMALDITALHLRLDELINRTVTGPQFDLTTVGDPQTTVSHIGNIIMFIQVVILRFKIFAPAIRQHMRAYDPTAGELPRRAAELSTDEMPTYQAWFAVLFDKKSEGIEDSIFRSTKVLTLMKIAPALVSEAITAAASGTMDKDVFDNGVAYFLGPLLNWTLTGVVRNLLNEWRQSGFASLIHLEVLKVFMMSPTTPRTVLQICSPILLRIMQEKAILRLKTINPAIDIDGLRQHAMDVAGTPSISIGTGSGRQPTNPAGTPSGPPTKLSWSDLVTHAVHTAIGLAASGQPTFLNVHRCLLSTTPARFLQTLWTQSAMMSGPACQRLVVFALTAPQVRLIPGMARTTNLLPVFLQAVLPRIIVGLDLEQQPSRDSQAELLVAIITSSLTVSHCLTDNLMNGPAQPVPSPAMVLARELAKGLQAEQSTSPTSQMVLQRLAAMPVFCTRFSMFALP